MQKLSSAVAARGRCARPRRRRMWRRREQEQRAGQQHDPSTAGKKGGTITILARAGTSTTSTRATGTTRPTTQISGVTTQRPLYSLTSRTARSPTPDLAAGMPQVSNGGKTVTIKIRTGIKYSPPVANRRGHVRRREVRHGARLPPQVGNGYAGAYFGDIVGAQRLAASTAPEISGIQTPDKYTVVFQLTKPSGVFRRRALALPLHGAGAEGLRGQVRRRQARRRTGSTRSSPGPYMIENDGSGTIHAGYQPGPADRRSCATRTGTRRRAGGRRTSTRSSSRTAATSTVAARKILNGHADATATPRPPPADPEAGPARRQKASSQITPTRRQPLHRAEHARSSRSTTSIVRKAVASVIDRTPCGLTRGGPIVGDHRHALHPAGLPGFDQAGGFAGPGYDFDKNPNGDLAMATANLKKAGYPSGKYTGPPLLTVADNLSPAPEDRRGVAAAAREDRRQGEAPRGAARDDVSRSSAACRRRAVPSARTSAGSPTSTSHSR